MPPPLPEMVTVRFDGLTLTLQGHAGSAPYGQDLVCAAVSALVYTLAQRLTELERAGGFEKPPVIRLSSGAAQISAFPKAEQAAEVMGAFRLIQSGMKLLATHYPEQVKVTQSAQIKTGKDALWNI